MSPPPWTLDHYGQPFKRTTLAFRASAIFLRLLILLAIVSWMIIGYVLLGPYR
jgi:hypothetical protein